MIVRIATFLLSFLLISAHAEAQPRPAGPPSATIRIKQLQVAFIGSGAIGGGTLRFRNNS
ncbi:hypothetical protein SAMN05428997_11811 [Bosea sp. CRIB-10]|uniref:hypothetical protein n=1 Tax=Bosea sp. CRIB-10 TaxID=378404 RepID=UPI0008DF657A|nr:hypothetical protein [Bosea sp. CRIB-10]SFD11513.1 hypothetical protein SAMN05428997_11811 [Bosea sp. CRIB-10]